MNKAQTHQKNSSVSISYLTVVLKQHAHSVFLSSLLLSICGIVGVSLLPNVYRATTTILVDPQKIPEKYVTSTVTTDPNERMNTLTQQVLSASHLQEIIDKDNLYPELRRTKSQEEILDYMRDKTKIEIKQSPEPEQGLGSFSIAYEDQDRTMVALVTNQLASSFIDWSLKARQQQALGTTQFLSSELQKAKEGLEAQESQLESFRMKHSGATPDELNGNLQALSRLQASTQSNMDAISRLDQERILLTHAGSADPQAIPSSDRQRALQEKLRLENERWTLKRQFTDTYPDVIAVNQELKAINAKLATMPGPSQGSADNYDENTQVRLSLIDKDMQRHKQQLADLERQIQVYQSKVDSVPVLETQLAELTRNYEASRQNYQSLLDKTFSAGMSEELERKQQAERFTVLDPAKTPEKPVRPKRLPIMAGVLLVCFILPTGLAFSFQILRGSINSEPEMRGMLPPGVAVLGTLPPIKSKADLIRGKLLMTQTLIVSFVACSALVVFLFKIRPIL
ncbi:GNVR domain-containing protein [Edaphobacter paludis]|uniref:GNVR domain-containing protein n=1 Tax=Edaphobacter paludis TaxID=3035702 RepID=A0AAU7CUI3_9BACT